MVLQTRHIGYLATAIAVYLFFDLFSPLYFVSSLGLALVSFVFLKFFFDLGKKVEIRDIIALIATTQWILAPILAYYIFPPHPVFYMAVDETHYMNFVVPSCYALVAGMYLPLGKEREFGQEQLDRIRDFISLNPSLSYILVGAGLFFNFIGNFMPRSLTFVFFLLGNMQFVGLFLLMLTEKAKWKGLIVGSVLFLLIGQAVLQGMFHELLLWLTFLFLIFAFILHFSFSRKLLLFILGIFLITLLQSVKEEYRQQTWYKTELAAKKQNIFLDVIMERLSSPSVLFQEEMMNNINARMNQGWIIARILNHVPLNENFARGETIKKGIEAALFPRFIKKDKAVAGGQQNFERFTGTPLNKNTSMDLSIAGEAYANFGIMGGIVFMLAIGIFYNSVLVLIMRLGISHPILPLFIPLLFFQVIKAETDFTTVFNHLIKAVIIVVIIFAGFRFFLKIKI